MQRVKFLIFSLFLSVPLVHAEGRLSRRQGGPSSGPPPAPPPRLFKCKTGETGYCNGGYLIENGITMSPAGNKGGNVWDGSIVGYSSATLACCNKNFYYTQTAIQCVQEAKIEAGAPMEFTGDLPASTSSSAGLNEEMEHHGIHHRGATIINLRIKMLKKHYERSREYHRRLAASQGNYDDPNGEGIFVADRTILGGRGWARLHNIMGHM
ncbi:hypothetical protein Pst134EB_008249 [Puccinia striiformis f. sp. tritici]|nr:hypothetical protein Pst134EB_008249 [Puccinia striiformis f. sp. tritici]